MSISIIIPTVRTNLWKKVYTSLSKNDIDFDIIFLGPGCGELPPRSKFVETHVKPSQCWEAGIRISKSEFCIYFFDDCVFSPHALDIMMETYKKNEGKYVMVSGIYCLHRENQLDCQRLYEHNSSSPIIPQAGLYRREEWLELGGIDRRFLGRSWDIDLSLRFLEAGGKTIICNNVIVDETKGQEKGRYSFVRTSYHDRPLVESLWNKDYKRTDKVHKFSDENILTENQC